MSSKPATLAHIRIVQGYLKVVIDNLIDRSACHDASKLESPEVEILDKFTPLLADLKYLSPEYKACLAEMAPGLEHHYAVNRHHPEYFTGGVADMNLMDIIEMLVDWKAAGERHIAKPGCVFRSIVVNANRFKYGEEMSGLLANTAMYLGWSPRSTEPAVFIGSGDGPRTELPPQAYHLYHNAVAIVGNVDAWPSPYVAVADYDVGLNMVFRDAIITLREGRHKGRRAFFDFNSGLPSILQLPRADLADKPDDGA